MSPLQEIKQFGFYTLQNNLQELSNSFISHVTSVDGKRFFIKIPKGLQTGSGAGRMFSNTLQKLKSINNPYLGKVIDYGNEQGHFYLVMEDYSEHETLEENADREPYSLYDALTLWYECAIALQTLSGSNIFHRDLHPKNIIITEDEIKIIDIGWAELEHAISKNEQQLNVAKEFAAPELLQQNESLNRRHSDVYSLAQIVVYLLIGHEQFYEYRNTESRLQKIKEKYQDYNKGEIIEFLLRLLAKCLDIKPQNRFDDYVQLQKAIKDLLNSNASLANGTVLIALEETNYSADFFKEANEYGIYIEPYKNSEDKNDIRIATRSFFLEKAKVIESIKRVESIFNVVFQKDATAIVFLDYLANSKNFADGKLKKTHERILKYGYHIGGAKFENASKSYNADTEYVNVIELNNRIRIDLKVDNIVTRLSKNQDDEFTKWDTLLKEEMDFIKNNGFKVRYSERSIDEEKSQSVFKLVNPNDQIVFDFLNKTRASKSKKEEPISLLLPGSVKSAKGQDISIGYAANYNKVEKELRVNNFTADPDLIPTNGELIEDIEKQLSQFKRQRKAISDFKKGEMVNPELRKYLFNAAQLPEAGLINSGLTILSLDKKNVPIAFRDSQMNAIEKCLFRSPYALIQGPPGTGKTTVITEVIRQIIKNKPEVKILITSQTNLAVDNVLYKISKDKNIRFIRLGAEERISFQELKKESYENKLITWGNRAREKSKNNFNATFKKTELNPILNTIVKTYEENKNNWKQAKEKLSQVLAFSKNSYSSLLIQLESKDRFEKSLKEFLPESTGNYATLKNIHEKWLQVISNIKDKPTITQRMVNSVNVIAATCNHIAAGMYRDYKFNFDYMIMDEAAKATLPETLVPLNMAKNIILIGDHQQLPPLVLATKSVKDKVEAKLKAQLDEENIDFDKMYLEEPTLFETMYENANEDYREMLDTQFRMPILLGNMVSEFVYDKKLKSELASSGKPHGIKNFESVVLISTSTNENRFSKRNGNSHLNEYNAKIICNLLEYIDTFDEVKNYSIGIITGYKSQVFELEKMLRIKKFKNITIPKDFQNGSEKELVVSTVDKFQGSEKDIIIFDVVKSEVNGSLGFLTLNNRINVAFSRAQRLMLCVADVNFIIKTAAQSANKIVLEEFVKHMLNTNQVIDANEIPKLLANG